MSSKGTKIFEKRVKYCHNLTIFENIYLKSINFEELLRSQISEIVTKPPLRGPPKFLKNGPPVTVTGSGAAP